MMLGWFLRQDWRNKLAVSVAALFVTIVIWTAAASYLFIDLMGHSLRQYYPRSDIESYTVWWDYFTTDGQPKRVHLWLTVSGVAAALPFAAVIVRQIIDHVGTRVRQSLYGQSGFASTEDMTNRGIVFKKEPFEL